MGQIRFTNALSGESSPYLLQHAHNPVDWHPWGSVALNKAANENKLLLLSIGYAACHWCHVMELECFSDDEVAMVMNERFICIKVDREERPDVDHYFMAVLQLTGVQGGWPLNCIALPDGRPIWGGTYFPKERWIAALTEIHRLYINEADAVTIHAEKLSEGIRSALMVVSTGADTPASKGLIDNAVGKWKNQFDRINGGRRGRPKFPMPVNLDFLLHYAYLTDDRESLALIQLTLDKIALGGIYDHAGGGFARYATDEAWNIPHFEKMLYDNGQLISVYAKAFMVTGKNLYKLRVYETISFLEREMRHPSGGFYSSLDADSEGVEGRFYVWTKRELQNLLRDDFGLFADVFNVRDHMVWEDGNYILNQTALAEELASRHQIDPQTFELQLATWKQLLLGARSARVRPALDDKVLASWNALVIIGLCDAAKAFGEERFAQLAIDCGRFIITQMLAPDGSLFHTWREGKPSVPGFLEDYALSIQAFIHLFSLTGKVEMISYATSLVEKAFSLFYDEQQELFLFSPRDGDNRVINHFQVEDNVVPSSNSVMAINLFQLHQLLGVSTYLSTARRMARRAVSQFSAYPQSYANWGRLFLLLTYPANEVAIVGKNAMSMAKNLQQSYLPQTLVGYSERETEIPLFENRYRADATLLYVCSGGKCHLPVETVADGLKILEKESSKPG